MEVETRVDVEGTKLLQELQGRRINRRKSCSRVPKFTPTPSGIPSGGWYKDNNARVRTNMRTSVARDYYAKGYIWQGKKRMYGKQKIESNRNKTKRKTRE